MADTLDLLALSLLPAWRCRLVAEQLRAGRSPAEILEQQCAERAARDPSATGADALRSRAAVYAEQARQADLRLLTWNESDYPASLSAIADPPPVLWLRGSVEIFGAPAVALVGSRTGSPYALAVAELLSSELAGRGLVVVSGLARGVDSAAHRGALGRGRTLAVLGCGADVVYPKEHEALAMSIVSSGAMVSELPPGTPPHRHFFPRRNRIISGLSRAVVVIEAGEKSGSLITARCALEQGRDVLAVPGNVLSGRNRGGHALLRDGARIVETADDVLDELGLAQMCEITAQKPGKTACAADSGRSKDPVLACLVPGEACDLDGLQLRTGLSPSRLLTRLFELEIQGHVRRIGGGRFVLFDRSC